jgi:hypothetical protein
MFPSIFTVLSSYRLSRLVHRGKVHARRKSERICIEHGVVWVEELVVHAIEDMTAVVGHQRSWTLKGRVL